MPKLQDTLTDAARRKLIIADCVTMIDEEVAGKGGISGLGIKAGYKVVKGVKPGFIPEVVDNLLDDFCKNLQPLADEAESKGTSVSSFFVSNKSRVADALLAVTDGRAQKTKHGVVKSMYEKLRPTAKKNVEDAVPRVGTVIEKYTK